MNRVTNKQLKYAETPVQELINPAFDRAGVRLLVKREDLNHPTVSGNKWWKLKYNIQQALAEDHETLLTLGGAFSNHIYATAAAAAELGLKSIGIIRGQEHKVNSNYTLKSANSNGMLLHFVTREQYKQKNERAFLHELHERFGSFFLIPEGGTNALAIKGVQEFGRKLLEQIAFDYLITPVGTGGTLAGLAVACGGKKEVMGIAVLKGGATLEGEIASLLKSYELKTARFRVLTDYHFGGYANYDEQLLKTITECKTNYSLPLDHVYTAKMMAAVFCEIERGTFTRGSTILCVHTGGLQGAKNFLSDYPFKRS